VMRPFDLPILALIALAGIWFVVKRIKAIRLQEREEMEDAGSDW